MGFSLFLLDIWVRLGVLLRTNFLCDVAIARGSLAMRVIGIE